MIFFSHRSSVHSTTDFLGFNVLLPGNLYLKSEVLLGFFPPKNTKIKKKKIQQSEKIFLTKCTACQENSFLRPPADILFYNQREYSLLAKTQIELQLLEEEGKNCPFFLPQLIPKLIISHAIIILESQSKKKPWLCRTLLLCKEKTKAYQK